MAQIAIRFPISIKAAEVRKLSPSWAFQNLPITLSVFIDLFWFNKEG